MSCHVMCSRLLPPFIFMHALSIYLSVCVELRRR
jgi:hypothetical protein